MESKPLDTAPPHSTNMVPWIVLIVILILGGMFIVPVLLMAFLFVGYRNVAEEMPASIVIQGTEAVAEDEIYSSAASPQPTLSTHPINASSGESQVTLELESHATDSNAVETSARLAPSRKTTIFEPPRSDSSSPLKLDGSSSDH